MSARLGGHVTRKSSVTITTDASIGAEANVFDSCKATTPPSSQLVIPIGLVVKIARDLVITVV